MSFWQKLGLSGEYFNSASDRMSTLCTNAVQRHTQQQQQEVRSQPTIEEIDSKLADDHDYHPNTPSSSVADEKDLAERGDGDKLNDDEFDIYGKPLFTSLKNVSLMDSHTSGQLGTSTDGSESEKHVTFFENVDLPLNHSLPLYGGTNKLIINHSDISSEESGSPKNLSNYELSGARPKIRNFGYNSANSAHSPIVDHSIGVHSPASAASRSSNWSRKLYDFPILFVSPHGTIAVYLREGCIVEMTVNKTIRVECQGKFSAATNAHGSVNCILHPDGRILQKDTRVQCLFGKNKVASFGPQGVIFNMKPLPMAYVVSSTIFKGTSPVPANCMSLPAMDYDFTMTVFYNESVTGPDTVPRCQEIVRQANYKFRDDGAITVLINGIFIRQDRFGNVLVNSRPRTIRMSPQKNTVGVRTHFVDMAVQEDEKAYVKRGVKRVHVSKSGMVVSDGNCITSMDHFGRIVSST